MNAKVNARGKTKILPSPHWPGEVLDCPLIWVICIILRNILILCHAGIHKTLYIYRLMITNLAGHLDLAGFYFSKCPANSKPPAFSSCDGGSPSLNILVWPGHDHAPPPPVRKLMLYQ